MEPYRQNVNLGIVQQEVDVTEAEMAGRNLAAQDDIFAPENAHRVHG